jgi:hypothetical protein
VLFRPYYFFCLFHCLLNLQGLCMNFTRDEVSSSHMAFCSAEAFLVYGVDVLCSARAHCIIKWPRTNRHSCAAQNFEYEPYLLPLFKTVGDCFLGSERALPYRLLTIPTHSILLTSCVSLEFVSPDSESGSWQEKLSKKFPINKNINLHFWKTYQLYFYCMHLYDTFWD